MHPVHDIDLPERLDAWFPVVIEIPRGSKLKYEVDKRTGMPMLDRVLYSVAIDDPAVAEYSAATQLPAHVLAELRRFFQDYKALEGKATDVEDFYDLGRSLDVIREAQTAYGSQKQ